MLVLAELCGTEPEVLARLLAGTVRQGPGGQLEVAGRVPSDAEAGTGAGVCDCPAAPLPPCPPPSHLPFPTLES